MGGKSKFELKPEENPNHKIIGLINQLENERNRSRMNAKLKEITTLLQGIEDANQNAQTAISLLKGGKSHIPILKVANLDGTATDSLIPLFMTIYHAFTRSKRAFIIGMFETLLDTETSLRARTILLETLLEILKTDGDSEKLSSLYIELVIPEMIQLFDQTDGNVILDLGLKCFGLLYEKAPDAIQLHFQRLIRLLMGYCLNDSCRAEDRTEIFNFFDKLANLILLNYDFSVELLLDLNFDLEKMFDIRCEPFADLYKPLSENEFVVPEEALYTFDTFYHILKALLLAPWNERIVHALHWNLEIGKLLGFQRNEDSWRVIFYRMVALSLSYFPAEHFINALAYQIVLKHHEYVCTNEVSLKDINNLLECLALVFGEHNIPIQPSLAGPFLDPKTSSVLKERQNITPNGRLFFSILVKSYPATVLPFWDELLFLADFVISGNEELPEEYSYLKDQPLLEILLFDLSVYLDVGKSGLVNINFDEMFQELLKIYERTSAIERSTHAWLAQLLSKYLNVLQQFAHHSGYFLPSLVLAPGVEYETSPLMEKQIEFLKNLFEGLYGERLCAIEWIGNILHEAHTKNKLKFNVHESEALMTLENLFNLLLEGVAFEPASALRLKIGELLLEYLTAFKGMRRGITKMKKFNFLIMSRFGDIDPNVSQIFFNAYCQLDVFDSLISLTEGDTVDEFNYLSEFKTLVTTTASSGTFTTKHFLLMATYLGLGKFVLLNNEYDVDEVGLNVCVRSWIKDLYYSGQAGVAMRMTQHPNLDILLRFAENSLEAIMYWALWETARYCIILRLRVPYGGPVEFLNSLESTLRDYADLTECDLSDCESYHDYAELRCRSGYFLIFLNLLEIQITNVSLGSTGTIPSWPAPCTAFFCGNVKVCMEFFGKNRANIAKLGLVHGNEGSFIRNSFNALRTSLNTIQTSENTDDVLTMIVTMIATFVQFKESDSLFGLLGVISNLSKEVKDQLEFQHLFMVMLSARHFTLGRLEEAAVELEKVLKSTENEILREYCAKLLLKCYSCMDDGQSVKKLSDYESLEHDYHLKLNTLSEWTVEEPNAFLNSGALQTSYSEMVDNCSVELLVKSKIFSQDLAALHEFELLSRVYSQRHTDSFEQLTFSLNLTQIACQQYESKYSDNNVRIGKPVPFDKVVAVDLQMEDLSKWLQCYNLLSKLNLRDRRRDPNINEVGAILADLAGDARNQNLAKKLLKLTGNNFSESASLRHSFKLASLYKNEKNYIAACSTALELLEKGLELKELLDLETRASACFLLTECNPLVDFKEQNLDAKLQALIHKPVLNAETTSFELLELATQIAPGFHQSWLRFGNFCYSIGRKLSEDAKNEDLPDFSEEIKTVQDVLRTKAVDDFETCFGLVYDEINNNLGEGSSKDWRDFLKKRDIEIVERSINTIKGAIIDKMRMATTSYFQYLIVASSQKNARLELGTEAITTTLRLIKTLANHGVALRSSFTQGFVDTPLQPWIKVIPQLFARLQHPEQAVRKEITSLLCRISVQYPELVVYSTILGKRNELSKECYESILQKLNQQNANFVLDTRKWIGELQRITVLWEELFQIRLEHMLVDMPNIRGKIKTGIDRVAENSSLSKEDKEQLIKVNVSNTLKPLLFTLGELCDQTIYKPAETKHEREFQSEFKEIIEEGFEILKKSDCLQWFDQSWEVFKNILKKLHTKSHMVKNQILELGSISPHLQNFQSDGIRMPGMEERDLYVRGVDPNILVLRSKTKPKKIRFLSNAGVEVSFLLKGHEDLNLDEKIQQFITISNSLLNSDHAARGRQLSARSYSVIPLGQDSGMIQWVENTRALFSLYQKHQSWRFSLNQLQSKESKPEHIPHPQEIFKFKLLKAVNDGLLNAKIPRSSPEMVRELRRIYQELLQETPNYLIYNSLFCSSYSQDQWWSKTKRFARTTAVMSMIGYIIGLGDRHLENILLDTKDGSIVHIDFNVCFEKGLRLKVPETVPFRLTQNIIRAFGPTDIEGNFRSACEITLAILRNHRELLLTLLEALIYDPLLSWTSENNSDKQILKMNIAIATIKSRANECKPELLELATELTTRTQTMVNEIEYAAINVKKYELLQSFRPLIRIKSILDSKISTGTTYLNLKVAEFREMHESYMNTLEKFDSNYSEIEVLSKSGNIFNSVHSDIFKVRDFFSQIDLKIQVLYINAANDLVWYRFLFGNDLKIWASKDRFGYLAQLLENTLGAGISSKSLKNTLKSISRHPCKSETKFIQYFDSLKAAAHKLNTDKSKIETIINSWNDNSVKNNENEVLDEKSAANLVELYILTNCDQLLQNQNDQAFFKNIFQDNDECLVEIERVLNETWSQERLHLCYLQLVETTKWILGKTNSSVTKKLLKNLKRVAVAFNFVKELWTKFEKLLGLVVSAMIKNPDSSSFFSSFIELTEKFENFNFSDYDPSRFLKFIDSVKDLKEKCMDENIQQFLNVVISLIADMEKPLVNGLDSNKVEAAKGIVRFIVCVRSVVQDSAIYINSGILELDPSGEFASILPAKLVLQKAEYSSSANCLSELFEFLQGTLILPSLRRMFSLALKDCFETKHSPVGKAWGMTKHFNESTGQPQVDKVRSYLNCVCHNDTKLAPQIKANAQKCSNEAVGEIKRFFQDLSVQRMKDFDESIKTRAMHVARYEVIHCRRLYDSHQQFKANQAEIVREAAAKLESISSDCIKLSEFLTNAESESASFEKRLRANFKEDLNFLRYHKEKVQLLKDYCDRLLEIENPNPNPETVEQTILILQDLLYAYMLKESDKCKLDLDNAESILKKQEELLKIDETLQSLNILSQKLGSVCTKLKDSLVPLLTIAENLTNSMQESQVQLPLLDDIQETLTKWGRFKSTFRNCQGSLDSMTDRGLKADLDILKEDLIHLSSTATLLIDSAIKFGTFQELDSIEEFMTKQTPDLAKKKVQHRNATAIKALKRVKAKLDGVLDEQKLRVPDQVKRLISHSTDPKNLALMFEGWTGWI